MIGFDFQPHLGDATVTLRPLAATDRDALFAAAADPLIWAHHPAHDRWQEPVFRRFFADALASGGALLIADAQTGDVAGTSRFDMARAGPHEIEIGWTFLARRWWGGAMNRAVKRLMIGHVLASADRAIFLVGAQNLRSRRALEKIGAVLTDRTVAAPVAGAAVVHVVYAIDRAGFAQGPLTAGEDGIARHAHL